MSSRILGGFNKRKVPFIQQNTHKKICQHQKYFATHFPFIAYLTNLSHDWKARELSLCGKTMSWIFLLPFFDWCREWSIRWICDALPSFPRYLNICIYRYLLIFDLWLYICVRPSKCFKAVNIYIHIYMLILFRYGK